AAVSRKKGDFLTPSATPPRPAPRTWRPSTSARISCSRSKRLFPKRNRLKPNRSRLAGFTIQPALTAGILVASRNDRARLHCEAGLCPKGAGAPQANRRGGRTENLSHGARCEPFGQLDLHEPHSARVIKVNRVMI